MCMCVLQPLGCLMCTVCCRMALCSISFVVGWHIHDLATQVQMFAISTLFERDDKGDEHLLSTHRQWRVTENCFKSRLIPRP